MICYHMKSDATLVYKELQEMGLPLESRGAFVTVDAEYYLIFPAMVVGNRIGSAWKEYVELNPHEMVESLDDFICAVKLAMT